MDHHIPSYFCPICKNELNCATGVDDDEKPTSGSLSICVDCGNIAVFDDDLKLRPPTPEEFQKIQADPIVQFFQKQILESKKTH